MEQQLLNLLSARQADLQRIVSEKKSAVKKSSAGSLKAIHRKNRNEYYLKRSIEYKINFIGYGTAYPDFMVLDLKNRRTIIWEHLGKMDDPDYVERNLRKINAYLKSGYIIGETLIITFESGSQPISTPYIEKLIRHYFC